MLKEEAGTQLSRQLMEQENAILEMIDGDAPLSETLEAICKAIEAETPGRLCSVLLLDEAGEHLLHGAAPSLPEAYCEAIHGISIGDGVGSCGTAAATGQPCYVEDIKTHANWAAFKGLAYDTFGLESCWSTPIHSYEGKVIATFAVYQKATGAPSLKDRKLIDFTSHLVTIAINRHRERQQETAPA